MTSHQVDPDFVPGVTEGGPVFHADCEPGGVLVTLGRSRSNAELWFEVRIEDVGAIYLPVSAIQGMLDDAGLIPDNHRPAPRRQP
jgi:hypothetical protein